MVVSEVWVVITEGVREVEVETAASLRVEGGSGGRDDEEVGGEDDEVGSGAEEVEEVRISELGLNLQVIQDERIRIHR